MKIYFDTSSLVALYVPNDHTAAALRHRAQTGRYPILFTPLHRLELRTTVRQCTYAGLISLSNGRAILRDIEEDLDDGTLIHQPLDWTKSLYAADAVAEKFGWTKPCRSQDLWHVAVALEIQAEDFVTFDKDQSALAQAAGLRTMIPL